MRNLLFSLLLVVLGVSAVPANAQTTTFYSWRQRLTTSCTALTDGKPADLCYQTSNAQTFVCVPGGSNTTCTTPQQWIPTTSGLAVNVVNPLIYSGGVLGILPASISQSGAVQLSNNVNGTSQSLAVTELALKTGLSGVHFTTGNLSTSTSGINIIGGNGVLVGSNASVDIQNASGTQPGLLTPSDWNNFYNKQAALTFGNLSESTSSVLTISGGINAVVGGGVGITVKRASSSQPGYLDPSDFLAFSGKQDALGFIPENVANKSTDNNLGTSNILYPTQNAVKSYIDAHAVAPVWGNITGTLANQTDLESVLSTKITDAASDGNTYARKNGAWTSIVSGVSSVNSQTGAVNLTTTNIPEGSNLYWTAGRFNTAFNNSHFVNLADINVSTPLNGQTILYDSGSSKWVNGTNAPVSGGGWFEDTANNYIHPITLGRLVGVGTSTPHTKLEVSGSLYVGDALGDSVIIGQLDPNNSNSWTYTPAQKLDVRGKISIADDNNAATLGAIRYSGGQFQGYGPTGWNTFIYNTTSAGGWTEDSGNNVISPSTLGRTIGIGASSTILGSGGNAHTFKEYTNGDTATASNALFMGKVWIPGSSLSNYNIPSTVQLLDVSGKIRIADDSNAASLGSIRYSGGQFQGYGPTGWNTFITSLGSAGGWTDDGSQYVYLTSNGSRSVGVGTTTPTTLLDVAGTENINTSLGIGVKTRTTPDNVAHDELDVNGRIRISEIIGIRNPVAGNMRWTGSHFQGYDGSNWLNMDNQTFGTAGGWSEDIGNNWVTLATSGRNVGIGNTAPIDKLDVEGNTRIDGTLGLGGCPY